MDCSGAPMMYVVKAKAPGTKYIQEDRLATAAIMAAAKRFNLTPADVRYGNVHRCILARRVVMFVLSRLGMTQRAIGDALGRSESCVLTGIGRVAHEFETSRVRRHAEAILKEFT